MKIADQRDRRVISDLAKEVFERTGENVFLCYQCRKCAAGCPNRTFMDSTPTELMRYLQLGMVDEAMKGNTIWYCLSCHTCSARCPQGIDIAHILNTVRMLGHEKRLKVKTNSAMLFGRVWMRMVKYTGRVYEVGLIGLLNLLRGKPLRDLPLGIRMLKRGKLRLLPSITRPLSTMNMFCRARKLDR